MSGAPDAVRRPGRCDAVQEAISASFDGEPAGVGPWSRRVHLRRCTECRRFSAGVQSLRIPATLVDSRRPPSALKATLARALVQQAGAPTPPRPAGRRRAAVEWRRAARWAGAIVPTAALAVLLPFGAFSAASGKPTHVRTPCILNVHGHRDPFR